MATELAAQATGAERFSIWGTLVITFAHFAHDLYGSFTAVLIPPVQEKLGIPLSIAALMVPAQQLPSVLQPFIGVLADRTSKRWFVVFAPAAAAISISSIGLAPHFAIVLLLLFASGLASASFHTPAVALAGERGGNKVGQSMAIFSRWWRSGAHRGAALHHGSDQLVHARRLIRGDGLRDYRVGDSLLYRQHRGKRFRPESARTRPAHSIAEGKTSLDRRTARLRRRLQSRLRPVFNLSGQAVGSKGV